MNVRQKAWETLKADGAVAALTNLKQRGKRDTEYNKLTMRLVRLNGQSTPKGPRLQKVGNLAEFKAKVSQLVNDGSIDPGNKKHFEDGSDIYYHVALFTRTVDPLESMLNYCFVLKEGTGRLKEFLIAEDNGDKTREVFRWVQDRPTDGFHRA